MKNCKAVESVFLITTQTIVCFSLHQQEEEHQQHQHQKESKEGRMALNIDATNLEVPNLNILLFFKAEAFMEM
jgi:translation initiation factor IF-3